MIFAQLSIIYLYQFFTFKFSIFPCIARITTLVLSTNNITLTIVLRHTSFFSLLSKVSYEGSSTHWQRKKKKTPHRHYKAVIYFFIHYLNLDIYVLFSDISRRLLAFLFYSQSSKYPRIMCSIFCCSITPSWYAITWQCLLKYKLITPPYFNGDINW